MGSSTKVSKPHHTFCSQDFLDIQNRNSYSSNMNEQFLANKQPSPEMITAEGIVKKLIQDLGDPFRLRITGFPACGKTTIAKMIQNHIPTITHFSITSSSSFKLL